MKMAISNPFKDQFHSLTKKLFPWTLYALLPIALLSLYLYPLPFLPSTESELPHSTSNIIISHSTPPSFASIPPTSGKSMHNPILLKNMFLQMGFVLNVNFFF
jgi:hypothetical protein